LLTDFGQERREREESSMGDPILAFLIDEGMFFSLPNHSYTIDKYESGARCFEIEDLTISVEAGHGVARATGKGLGCE
jgi:hypothetical protein